MIDAAVLDNAARYRAEFQAARPYRHVAIDGFFTTPVAQSLLADFPPFDKNKARNEVGEIGRKAVFEAVKGISPFYATLYAYINSAPFLSAMSELTGIPDLIADETLFGGGTHENLDGQGLDTHVDFNLDERRMLHRRLNLLVYLNKEWEDAWGGAIELHSNPWYPEADEVKSFLPLYNRALIFETNEYSWHGFKRITLPQGRRHLSRKSFSIYLYTKDRPIDEVVAPHTTFYVPPPLPDNVRAGSTLSESDAQAIRVAFQGRDGLIRMYQKLLVEKEQRLRDVIKTKQYASVLGPAQDKLMSVRSWRWVMRMSRLRHRVRRALRMPTARND
ncbi:MAG TPA: 2OG-Fe(II) oxygenase [Casimicrobiaceae bacterium]|nr:2OG-Fe(II) oxygenase [Casimicrobiaceae bacterium]